MISGTRSSRTAVPGVRSRVPHAGGAVAGGATINIARRSSQRTEQN